MFLWKLFFDKELYLFEMEIFYNIINVFSEYKYE